MGKAEYLSTYCSDRAVGGLTKSVITTTQIQNNNQRLIVETMNKQLEKLEM